MTKVAVLRPEPGASATIERARRLGLDAFAVPLFAIEPLPWAVPDPGEFDGLLLTSANAVRSAGPGLEQLKRLPAHCVGSATARAASDAGLCVATIGESGVAQLLALQPRARLVHLCGEDRIDHPAGWDILPIPVYAARAIESVDFGTFADSVALVHSPRAGQRLRALTSPAERATIAIAAISPAAAVAAGEGWRTVRASPSPDDEALLALAAKLCDIGRER